MLPPDGRAILVDLLKPPTGSDLVRGVATTFTLDLVHALTAPLAFASHRIGGGSDPMAVLEAVRHASDRLDIFCQAGQIQVPAGAPDLLAYLEPMVHPVASPHSGGLFHPKIWILEFSDGSTTSFRLLCSSRNLTGDRSWDAVLRLDGVRGTRPTAQNGPLRELLTRVPTWAIDPIDEDRGTRIQALAESIRYAEWELPDDVKELAFHLLGAATRKSSLDLSGRRQLVVSPFITDDGVARVRPDGKAELIVVSRVEELDRLDPGTLAGLATTYVVDDASALEADDSAGAEDALVGLHAKVYIAERGYNAHVFIGSANATSAAFDGNVEALVELVGSKSRIGINTITGPEAAFRQVLEEYQAEGGRTPTAAEEADLLLERALRDLAMTRFAGQVHRNGDRYSVALTAAGAATIRDGMTATVALITLPGNTAALAPVVDATFADLDMLDITPFLVIELTDSRNESRRTVVHAYLSGDPPERRDEVLARQIDTPEKFLRLLQLLLALTSGMAVDPAALLGAEGSGGWFGSGDRLFEALVRALGSGGTGLEDIANIVKRLQSTERGRAVLPPGFTELWDIVWAARTELVGRPA